MQLKTSSPSEYQNDSLSTTAPSSRSPTQMIPESDRKDVNEEPCQLRRTGTFTKYDRRPHPIKMTQLPAEAYHEKHQKAWTKLTAIAKGSNDTYGKGFNSKGIRNLTLASLLKTKGLFLHTISNSNFDFLFLGSLRYSWMNLNNLHLNLISKGKIAQLETRTQISS